MPTKAKTICTVCSRTDCECRGNGSRLTSVRRGYDYRWQKFRDRYLARLDDQSCQDCRQKPANELHHIEKFRHGLVIDKRKQYDTANLLPLCKDCHSARTMRGE